MTELAMNIEDHLTAIRGLANALYLAGHGLAGGTAQRSGIFQISVEIEQHVDAAEKLALDNQQLLYPRRISTVRA
jgi:hypothetical protein